MTYPDFLQQAVNDILLRYGTRFSSPVKQEIVAVVWNGRVKHEQL